jgi:hypothetical protein
MLNSIRTIKHLAGQSVPSIVQLMGAGTSLSIENSQGWRHSNLGLLVGSLVHQGEPGGSLGFWFPCRRELSGMSAVKELPL